MALDDMADVITASGAVTATLKVNSEIPSSRWVTPARSLAQAEKLERKAGYEIYCDDPRYQMWSLHLKY